MKGFDTSNGPDFPLDPSDLLPKVLVPEDLKKKTGMTKIKENTLKDTKYIKYKNNFLYKIL